MRTQKITKKTFFAVPCGFVLWHDAGLGESRYNEVMTEPREWQWRSFRASGAARRYFRILPSREVLRRFAGGNLPREERETIEVLTDALMKLAEARQ